MPALRQVMGVQKTQAQLRVDMETAKFPYTLASTTTGVRTQVPAGGEQRAGP